MTHAETARQIRKALEHRAEISGPVGLWLEHILHGELDKVYNDGACDQAKLELAGRDAFLASLRP
jgi:hypothetical protein